MDNVMRQKRYRGRDNFVQNTKSTLLDVGLYAAAASWQSIHQDCLVGFGTVKGKQEEW